MTEKDAIAWVDQELAKVDTIEKAKAHLESYASSCEGFFKSEAGKVSEQKNPWSRWARHNLAANVKRIFKL